MLYNHHFRTFPAPERCHKRFEKTRSRRVYHAIWGLGEITPTSRIVNNDITMPRLPFLFCPFLRYFYDCHFSRFIFSLSVFCVSWYNRIGFLMEARFLGP